MVEWFACLFFFFAVVADPNRKVEARGVHRETDRRRIDGHRRRDEITETGVEIDLDLDRDHDLDLLVLIKIYSEAQRLRRSCKYWSTHSIDWRFLIVGLAMLIFFD